MLQNFIFSGACVLFLCLILSFFMAIDSSRIIKFNGKKLDDIVGRTAAMHFVFSCMAAIPFFAVWFLIWLYKILYV